MAANADSSLDPEKAKKLKLIQDIQDKLKEPNIEFAGEFLDHNQL